MIVASPIKLAIGEVLDPIDNKDGYIGIADANGDRHEKPCYILREVTVVEYSKHLEENPGKGTFANPRYFPYYYEVSVD